MRLPSDSDYNGAIQNPGFCFLDPELKAGMVELMPALPLPKARSGNFATVYKVITQGRAWAVRCFTRAIPPDQQRRYTEISRTVVESRLPYFVDFNYLPKGIKVGAQWFPIVKMEWVAGEPLDSYIQRRLTAPTEIAELAAAWLKMTAALKRAGIAHGDLQHGNVLVANGRLRLVDYDGMFVPSLAGSKASEVGHRNYQHPLRNEGHFGPWLDHFSSWVIFVSLLGLAADPSLWQRHKGGDDCLLLRRADFLLPDRSAVLNDLTSLRDGRARAAAALFRSLVAFPPDRVPAIDQDSVPDPPRVPVSPPTALPSWITDNRPTGNALPTTSALGSSIGATAPGAAWVLDHIAMETSRSLDWGPVTSQRAILGLSATAATLLSYLTSPQPLHWTVAPLLFASINVAALRAAYRRSAPFKALAEAGLKEAMARKELRVVEIAIRELEERAHAATSAARDAQQKVATEIAVLDATRDAQLFEARKEQKAIADAHATRLQKISLEEHNEIHRATSTAKLKLARAQKELSDLIGRESAQVQQEIIKVQETFIDDVLRRTPLDHVPTGSRYLDLLRRSGILTAYDATDARITSVYGVGPKTESYIQIWRADLVNRARARAANTLPPATEAQIRGRFAQDRARLQGEVAAFSQQQVVNAVKERFDHERLKLNAELRNALQVHQAREQTAITDHAQESKSIHARSMPHIESFVASAKQAQSELGARQKERFDAVYTHQRSVRERELLQGATFTAYLRRILGLA
jgi:hypothetical protein